MGFTDKNGGLMAGHSEKWAEKNRRKNSFNAGQGDRASRNQGTGERGKANTVASDTIDTSKMKPEEKMKYFNSLGLLGSDKEKPAKMNTVKKELPKPKLNTEQGSSTVSKLRTELMDTFQGNPGYVREILNFLKDDVPKEKFKYFSQKAYRALQEITVETDNQQAIVNYIMDTLNDAL